MPAASKSAPTECTFPWSSQITAVSIVDLTKRLLPAMIDPSALMLIGPLKSSPGKEPRTTKPDASLQRNA
jgi:hypothetical protein